MITINIPPVLFSLGPFVLSWHGLFIVIAIIAAVWLSSRLCVRAGLSADQLFSIAIWAVPGGVIGARLVHVIDYWDVYIARPATIFALWEGGLAIWGAILGGIITTIVYAWVRRFSIAAYMDQIAPGLILAQAIGRIGDIINGEHFSALTNLPWAVVYTHPDSPAFGRLPSHPAVAYEMLLDLLILGILFRMWGKLRPDGALFLVYLILYSVGRFFLSFLRLDSNTVFLWLNQPQWICLIVLAVAVPLLVYRRAAYRKQQVSD